MPHDTDPKLRTLRRIPTFANLGRPHLRELAANLDIIEIPRGTTLLTRGLPGQEFFVVIAGAARVERDGQIIAMVGGGELLGEMAVLDHTARSATVVAETDMVLAVGMRQHLGPLLDHIPELEAQVRETYLERHGAA